MKYRHYTQKERYFLANLANPCDLQLFASNEKSFVFFKSEDTH